MLVYGNCLVLQDRGEGVFIPEEDGVDGQVHTHMHEHCHILVETCMYSISVCT